MFIAGPIEFFGGLLIMIGLWTHWVAFICSGEMAFAYWSVHGTHAILPVMNGGELAIIYCFLFLFIASRGSGMFSLDHFLEKRRQNLKRGIHPDRINKGKLRMKKMYRTSWWKHWLKQVSKGFMQ